MVHLYCNHLRPDGTCMSHLPLECQHSSEYTEIGSWDQAPEAGGNRNFQNFVRDSNAVPSNLGAGCKAVQNHTIQCTIARHILMIHVHVCERSRSEDRLPTTRFPKIAQMVPWRNTVVVSRIAALFERAFGRVVHL